MNLREKLLNKKPITDQDILEQDKIDQENNPFNNPDVVDEESVLEPQEAELPSEDELLALPESPVQPEVIGAIKAKPETYEQKMAKSKDQIGNALNARMAQESDIERQIQEQEQAQQQTFENQGIARGLMAGGNVLAGVLGNINKFDAAPIQQGFQSGLSGLENAQRQQQLNRAYLKERLSRADQPFRAMTDAEILKQRAQTQLQAEEEAPLELGEKRIKSDLLQKKTMGDTELAKASRLSKAIELRQAARTALQNKDSETAKQLTAFAKNIEDGKLSQAEIEAINKLSITKDEDKSLEWFKALTARKALEERKPTDLNKDLKELSKRVRPAMAVDNAFAKLEEKIGPLNEADKKDLPGVNIPGIGRVAAYSAQAREIESLIQSITGPLSNARYGASQTQAELNKLAKELGEGKFNNEAERFRALNRLKELNQQAIAEEKSGFGSDVVDLYETRRGEERQKISNSSLSGTSQKQRIKVNSGDELPDL